MTSTGNAVGMEGRASGPECAENIQTERETGGLCERLRKYRPTNEWGDPVHHMICDEAAAELERLRGALADLVSWFVKPDFGGRVWVIPAGDDGADDAIEAARALKTEGTSNDG